ncbi:MAG: hypothetical protein MUD01_15930 [Chloroflexaceae bacterium]|nr:hypothetical protein [Chloroflexaceae bacterium]
MIDQSVQQLLEHAIDTPTKLHLLLLFHGNPQLETTARHIAEHTCRDIWSVNEALSELAEDGILHVLQGSGGQRYRFVPRAEFVEAINRLVRGYDDPLERDVLHRSIRDLAGYAYVRRARSYDNYLVLG